jgi:hypothetical protein
VQMVEINSDWEIVSGMAATMAEADTLESTYKEAQSLSDWPEWKKAILTELNSLKAASTWELVERPFNTNIIDSKWVFCVKKDAEGNITMWKACLIACGFTQVYGINYFETFVPVAKLASICSILWCQSLSHRHFWAGAKSLGGQNIYTLTIYGHKYGIKCKRF